MAVAIVLLLGLTASRVVTGEIDRAGGRAAGDRARRRSPACRPGDAEAARGAPGPARRRPRGAPRALATRSCGAAGSSASSGDAPRGAAAVVEGPRLRRPRAACTRRRSSRREALRAVWAEGGAALVLERARRRGLLRRPRAADRRSTSSSAARCRSSRRESATAARGPGSVGAARSRIEAGRPARQARRPESGFLFVALPEKTNWDDRREERVRRDAVAVPVRARGPSCGGCRPIQLPRDASGRSVPDLLLYAMGILGLVFVVMYGVALVARPHARPLDHAGRPRALGGHAEAARRATSTTQIRCRSRDQLGELAESFNLMSRGHPAAHARAGREGAARGGAAHRAADPDEPAAGPGARRACPGVRIAALCLPAAEVGGDYYDLLPLGETRMGVLVADVSGKGTSAALYMAELKGLVLSLSRIYESPAKLLGEANRILAANMDSRSFVTMTYAVVDTAARQHALRPRRPQPAHPLPGADRPHARPHPGRARASASTPASASTQILEEDEVALEPGRLLPLLHRRALRGDERRGRALRRGPAAAHPGGQRGGSTSEELQGADPRGGARASWATRDPHDDMTLVVLKVVPEEKAGVTGEREDAAARARAGGSATASPTWRSSTARSPTRAWPTRPRRCATATTRRSSSWATPCSAWS